MILVEEIPSLKMESNYNINFDFDNKEDVEDFEEEEDILFDYERYNINSIRNEVIKDSKIKIDEDVEMEDAQSINKNYEYYQTYNFFK